MALRPMALNPKMRLGTEVEMRLSPRLYQVMDLLHLPVLEVEQYLRGELVDNPFLEMERAEEESLEVLERKEDQEEPQNDWEEILRDYFEAPRPTGEGEEAPDYQPPLKAEATLYDHLLDQLALTRLSPEERRIGEEIIGNLNQDGYLSCSLAEVVASLSRETQPVSEEEVERVLKVIQTFDPPGMGARDLRECLLLQLQAAGEEDSLASRLLRDHFKGFSQRRWVEIAKALKVSVEAIQQAADRIARLDPRPGHTHEPATPEYIVPDFLVEAVGGEFRVSLAEGFLPRLRLSPLYYRLAQDRGRFQGQTREFIAERVNRAQWIIQALHQRRATMLRVMRYLVERQGDFLRSGPSHLKPLIMRDVAEALGLHESTVSRVVNGKYVQTPRGLLPVKAFFSRHVATAGGEKVSARMIKEKLGQLISGEDPRDPLSDRSLTEILRREGISLARRTVQKYREQLKLLPSRLRRRV